MKETNNHQVVIHVSDIRKSFRIFNDKSNTLKERILFWKRGKHTIHQVLKGINLEIRKGETVALIGQNGSGKSTLLKLLTGIMYPDEGKIVIDGKVSSLLELGAGFHPDFSGRENIYNNASIFGLSKKEIDHRYDRIVAFSELEEYIDTPVRTYSSGMYMRLAFSVAINVDADILLIDEILAVGDSNFQKKCMDMIRHLKKQGVTIVLVTHDMGAVERICDRAVWIVDGYIKKQGKPREIIDDYLMDMDEKSIEIAQKEKARVHEIQLHNQQENEAERADTEVSEMHSEKELVSDKPEPAVFKSKVSEITALEIAEEIPAPAEPHDQFTAILEKNENGEKIRWGTGAVIISDVEILDSQNISTAHILTGKKMSICFSYKAAKEVESLVLGISINSTNGELCLATNSDLRHISLPLPKVNEKRKMKISIDHLDLAKGSYSLDLAAHSLEGLPYDYQQGKYSFMISSLYNDVGIYVPEIHFQIDGEAYT